ncbi:UNVERIFIED_CONTAM: hypothetical protein Slati_2166000 [Sesamum latifolium]|uniref:Uncharacterized protein n=1 Tax=Sesamum latifolium TaxID=2727402 RepID=A0AAW2WSB3_9LAMI
MGRYLKHPPVLAFHGPFAFESILIGSIDEKAIDEVIIDLVGSSGEEGENPTVSDSASRHVDEREEEGKSIEEKERKKVEDRLVRSGLSILGFTNPVFARLMR